jgi:hypothetical protein
MGADASTRNLVDSVWEHQSVWSQTANLLKARIDRMRATMLALAVASAVLTTLATQTATLSTAVGRVLALSAGITVGLVPVVRSRLGRDAVSRWTRARAVSEELKAECYRFLAGVAPYRGPDRQALLAERTRRVQDAAVDLVVDTAGVAAVKRDVPPVTDVASYVDHRIVPQIRWYQGRSNRLARRLARARQLELGLAVVGVLLAATASTWRAGDIAAWVAVVTTLTAALSSHVAASRWEYQLVEYLRTAEELNRIREGWVAEHATGRATDDESADRLVEHCEHVVSIQNDGWMAKWTADLR